MVDTYFKNACFSLINEWKSTPHDLSTYGTNWVLLSDCSMYLQHHPNNQFKKDSS